MFYALNTSTLLATGMLLQPKPTSSSSPPASSLATSSTSSSAPVLSLSPVKDRGEEKKKEKRKNRKENGEKIIHFDTAFT
jgi:hypothetical protein